MVSEAVEEVLNLVQNATQTFKAMIGTENDPLTQGQRQKKLPSLKCDDKFFVLRRNEIKLTTSQGTRGRRLGKSTTRLEYSLVMF